MPLPEECVTFQIALIGSDGLVVGSDQKSTRQIRESIDENPTTEMGKQEKFLKSDDGSLVCFFAGGPTCQTIAATIAMHCTSTSMSDLRWQTAVRTRVNNADRVPSLVGDQFIIIRKHISNSVWLAQRTFQTPATVNEYKNQILCTGNNALAKFLPTHLWESRFTIRQLKTLALLTLAYAAKENPSTVGPPFDLMTLDKNQIFEWSKHESEFTDAIFDTFHGKLKAAFDELPLV
jgi:hypothetical protein